MSDTNDAVHSPTPWYKNGLFITDSNMNILVVASSILPVKKETMEVIDDANAEHIIKCVNSHDDLVNALINCRQEMRQIKGEIEQLYQHIDEPDVIANIAEYIRTIPASGHFFDDALETAEKALQKAGVTL